jgi:hypothetical protein
MTQSLSEELHAIAAGLVGGARYGFKIRLPHAMVMIWLFRRDLSSKQKMKTVGTLVVEHTTNLAAFAALYKVCRCSTLDSSWIESFLISLSFSCRLFWQL